jgi:hypothetical protein
MKIEQLLLAFNHFSIAEHIMILSASKGSSLKTLRMLFNFREDEEYDIAWQEALRNLAPDGLTFLLHN